MRKIRGTRSEMNEDNTAYIQHRIKPNVLWLPFCCTQTQRRTHAHTLLHVMKT